MRRLTLSLTLLLAAALYACGGGGTPTSPTPTSNNPPVTTPTPNPTPNPTPAPNPTPNPNPTPAPNPTPNPTPAPNPTPNPAPNPTPTPNPAPQPPPGTSNMTWSLSDGCNDGRGMRIRLYDKTNNLLWPNQSQVYVIGPGGTFEETIACRTGARICYGAETDPANTSYWGVGIDGTRGCDNCCFTCDTGRVARNLVCN